MNKSNIVVSAIVSVIVLILGVSMFGGTDTVVEKLTVGASPGPEYFETQTFTGGVQGTSKMFNSTTTLVCRIQNPTLATSTFTASWQVNRATSTATTIQVSTSTVAGSFATTAPIQSTTMAANAKGSGSYVPLENENIVGPTDFVLFGYTNGTTLPLVAQQQGGFCQVLFNEI